MEPIKEKLPRRFTGGTDSHKTRFCEYDLEGKVYIVTGGGQGLGLSLAEALVEAGATVHCLDRQDKPNKEFEAARQRSQP